MRRRQGKLTAVEVETEAGVEAEAKLPEAAVAAVDDGGGGAATPRKRKAAEATEAAAVRADHPQDVEGFEGGGGGGGRAVDQADAGSSGRGGSATGHRQDEAAASNSNSPSPAGSGSRSKVVVKLKAKAGADEGVSLQLVCFCESAHLFVPGVITHVFQSRGVHRASIVPHDFSALARLELYTTLVEHHGGQMYYEGLQEAVHALDATRAPPEWTPFNQVTHCSLCESDFGWNASLANREDLEKMRHRHHCVGCGRVVCDECSTRRYVKRQNAPLMGVASLSTPLRSFTSLPHSPGLGLGFGTLTRSLTRSRPAPRRRPLRRATHIPLGIHIMPQRTCDACFWGWKAPPPSYPPPSASASASPLPLPPPSASVPPARTPEQVQSYPLAPAIVHGNTCARVEGDRGETTP